ncbi:MAG: YCF48-related protein [Candidatus Eisenbacteria bacterium]
MTLDHTSVSRLGRALMVTVLLLVAGCSSNTSSPVAPPVTVPLSSLTVTPHADTVFAGGQAQLVTTAYDTLGALVGNVAITWTSSNTGVVTVSSNGVVTGRGEGSAWVRAESGGRRDSSDVFVRSALGWALQSSGASGANLNGVYFRPDGRTGWAVGAGGRIIVTTDAGATWKAQTSGTASNLHRVWFVSDQAGVAVGDGGNVVATTNGGALWTRNPSIPTTVNLVDVKFADALHGWAVGGTGVVLNTTDGGASWSKTVLPTSFQLRGVAFAGLLDGWVVGDGGTVFGTHDGGSSWYPLSLSTIQSLRGVWRLDATHTLAAGQVGTIAVALAGPDSVVWSVPAPNAGASNQLEACMLIDAQVGYAVGFNSGVGGVVLRTDDGGLTWQTQVSNTSTHLNDVFFVDSQRGWAVGDGGIIIHTANAGF